jgi:exopolysaccharide production protein ExoY
VAIHDSTEFASPCADAYDSPLGGWKKRAFDFAAALGALIILAPLLVLVSLLIYFMEGGPVMIRHQRIGSGGQKFACLKFRTMVTNGDEVLREHLSNNSAALQEWTLTRKLVDDPRVTKLGDVLRKTSLDELPQLFNILLGEMSFVGPRPIVEEEISRYGSTFESYRRARPGLTGLWQVSGRNDTSYDQRVELDKTYVSQWSFLRDIVIIMMTVPAVLKARGVH